VLESVVVRTNVVGIGPVVVQAFPDAARAFRDVGLRGGHGLCTLRYSSALLPKSFEAARPKVGEPGDVLLGRRGGCLVQVDRGHAFSLLAVSHIFICRAVNSWVFPW